MPEQYATDYGYAGASDTLDLSFDYRRGSGLPRRSFIVDVDLLDATSLVSVVTGHRAYSVTAPDALQAENVVRSFTLRNLVRGSGLRFRFTLIREVTEQAWTPEGQWQRVPLVTIPETFNWAIEAREIAAL